MQPPRSRAAQLLGLVVSGVLVTSALMFVLASTDGADTPDAPIVVQRARPTEVRPAEWEPRELPPVLPIDVPKAPVAAPEAVGGASPLAERIERTLERMSASLRDGPIDRSTWETEVRALAGSLGPDSVPRLLELAADASLPDEQLVAVAELLRPWSAMPGGLPATLPEAALAALRRSLDEQPQGPAATAAVRALGALGAPGDTARLLDELVEPASRSLASWGLQASPSVTLLDDLAGLLATDVDAESQAAILTTMQGWARGAEPARLECPSRDAAASTVAALLEDASIGPGLRQRAAAALVAMGGASARSVVDDLCSDPSVPDGLLRVAVAALDRDTQPASVARLEDELWDPSTPDPRRLALADGLVRCGESGPARLALIDVALGSQSPSDQRRALYSLGALSAGSDTVAAAVTALRASDPAVRAAGVWALDRTAGSAACAGELRLLSDTDASEDVRRSARRALEKLAVEPERASP